MGAIKMRDAAKYLRIWYGGDLHRDPQRFPGMTYWNCSGISGRSQARGMK
jgi:hypothetical protein